MAFFDAGMIVPVGHIDSHETHSGFDQSSSKQRVVSPRAAAVPVSRFRTFLFDVEGFASFIAGHHFEGLLLKLIHGIHHSSLINLSSRLIKLFQQAEFVCRSGRGGILQAGQKRGSLNGRLVSRRKITLPVVDLKRVVGFAEIRRSHVTRILVDCVRRWQPDVARQTVAGTTVNSGNVRTKRRIHRRDLCGGTAKPSGQHPVPCREVIAVVVMQRSNDGHLVRMSRLQRELLCQKRSGHVRRDC